MVTGFRAMAGGAPRGECELHRAWVVGARVCDGDGDGDSDNRASGRSDLAILEDGRRRFMVARDCAGWAATRYFWRRGNMRGRAR